MFSIFIKKPIRVTDIGWLGVDIHSHLLPGIDDGSKDLAESIGYIRRLESLGFSKLICTPHIFKELYPNSKSTILPVLENLTTVLRSENIGIELGAAAEYMIDPDFEVTSELMCLADKYVLIEMSYLNETPNIEQVIFELQIKGYIVVLAHPERYNFYHKDKQRFHRLKDLGCLFQLNLLSVLGYYGKGVKLAYEYLLNKGLYDLAGTDLHDDRHLGVLESAVRSGELHRILSRYDFRNLELFSNT